MAEQRTLGDVSSCDKALDYVHGDDGEEPDSDDDGTRRTLLIERMLASGW